MGAFWLIAAFAFIVFTGSCEGKQLSAYVSEKLSWFEAFEYCKRQNKQLVTVMDHAEHVQLGNAVHSCSNKCGVKMEHSWTSASDKDEEGKFVWMSTGKPVEHAEWVPRGPDNYQNNEDCVEVWSPPGRGHVFLNDRPCSDNFYVICESK